MDQDDFVRLAFIAFGLVILSFVILGFSRLVVPFRVAQTLAAPVGVIGFGLVVFLFLRATASATGIAPIEESVEE
ncbi:hypothetical protein ACLI4U_10145 [Natrialbaceae archaeon A-CW2]|uniref:Uncharacterized protein n=1 Tax=Natronosalvus hydrolyticus TaxID=2979988 RepID=A0AAP3E8D8_9EURY|nr:hypothetical protein [Natronosalvus amylolyticus]MCU4753777.1 hypothetical protein [Halobacteria archaeon AArc-curdl1]